MDSKNSKKEYFKFTFMYLFLFIFDSPIQAESLRDAYKLGPKPPTTVPEKICTHQKVKFTDITNIPNYKFISYNYKNHSSNKILKSGYCIIKDKETNDSKVLLINPSNQIKLVGYTNKDSIFSYPFSILKEKRRYNIEKICGQTSQKCDDIHRSTHMTYVPSSQQHMLVKYSCDAGGGCESNNIKRELVGYCGLNCNINKR